MEESPVQNQPAVATVAVPPVVSRHRRAKRKWEVAKQEEAEKKEIQDKANEARAKAAEEKSIIKEVAAISAGRGKEGIKRAVTRVARNRNLDANSVKRLVQFCRDDIKKQQEVLRDKFTIAAEALLQASLDPKKLRKMSALQGITAAAVAYDKANKIEGALAELPDEGDGKRKGATVVMTVSADVAAKAMALVMQGMGRRVEPPTIDVTPAKEEPTEPVTDKSI